jgi:hypothetical protein
VSFVGNEPTHNFCEKNVRFGTVPRFIFRRNGIFSGRIPAAVRRTRNLGTGNPGTGK